MARISLSAAVLLASAGQCAAFVVGPAAGAALRPSLRAAACPTPIVMAAQPAPLSRREALGAFAVAGAWAASPLAAFAEGADLTFQPLTNGQGVEYSVLKKGSGPKPKVGDLVAIRFKASYNGKAFDDTFATANSYYYRVGSDNIIKGLDLAVQNMVVGDRWALKVPPSVAFGEKGVKPSAGKARIPGGATIDMEVLFEIFPGAEEELLEINEK
ncbi:hypothetical protein T484DRAFT_1972211 [Baffinella frigidus]|nr:hypothetical protein T484DRAFT_1972211 [Cryptophyta sp. CCMP2293]